MFIEQSVGRRRGVRFAFLVVGAVPCVLLGAVAWWRHSAGHVASLEREASSHLGMPVDIGEVVHPRPGTLRLLDLTLGDNADGATITVPELEVEVIGDEVRIRVPRCECSAAGASVLAGLVGEWLARPARFPRSWVVDAGDVAWSVGDARVPGVGWHVECVAVGDARAVRVRREPATGAEVKVCVAAGAVTLEGVIDDPLPVAIVESLLGGDGRWAETAGPRAIVRGAIEAADDGAGWSGTCGGVIERIDLASLSARGTRGLTGEATVAIERIKFSGNRILQGDLRMFAAGGTITQSLLDGLVANLGCRPGPAYRSLGGDPLRRFDDLSCRVRIDESGLVVASTDGAGLIRSQGLSLLEPPDVPLSALRLAWLVSPAGRPAVPASPASAWLISVLPESPGRAGF